MERVKLDSVVKIDDPCLNRLLVIHFALFVTTAATATACDNIRVSFHKLTTTTSLVVLAVFC